MSLNYIFTPKKRKQRINGKVYKNDIAESPLLQKYGIKMMTERYGKIYKEYLKILLCNIDNTNISDDCFKSIK